MYRLAPTRSFRRGLKKYRYEQEVLGALEQVLDILIKGENLPAQYREHHLKGKRTYYLECHLRPDLLLIYFKDEKQKVVYLQDIGSHDELFG